LLAPPRFTGIQGSPNTDSINTILEQAFEESSTLAGFWMRLNESLDIGEFTTFSQKISDQPAFTHTILDRITQSADDELLRYIWGRYIHADGSLYTLDRLV
jgi:hypothetical protein